MNITTPSGMDWKAQKLFGKGAHRMKSVEWRHVLSSGILKYCIRGLLGKDQRTTLIELCNVVQLLCAEEVIPTHTDALEYRVHRVLSCIERDFPVTIHTVSLHLLYHLPMYIRRFGPLYSFWMYPMERFNSWIAHRVLNRRYPEATVMETYRIYELTFFLEMSGRLPGGSIVDVHGDDESMQHPSGDTDSEKLDGDAMANHGYSSHLEPDTVKELDSFYAKLYPEYGHLLSRYIKDKHSAERRDNTQHFPPLSRWIPSDESPLSIIEMSLCEGVSDNIAQYRMYTTMDKYRRTVRYGSVFAEQSSKVRVSSYVPRSSNGS